MTDKPKVLITGAGGEIGHELISFLSNEGRFDVVALDLNPLPEDSASKCLAVYSGDILNRELLAEIEQQHHFDVIFHLAAILSTGGEKNPERTHEVNSNGSFNLLALARKQTEAAGRSTIFIFPSTIAVYGIRSIEEKYKAGPVTEEQFLEPITMYGVNKLYVENLGRYYSSHYKLLREGEIPPRIDFRAVRFPGLISTETVPTGGTSDYAAEMIHAAARGVKYDCFVSEDSTIPFMVMPDAVHALIQLSRADAAKLTQRVYNVTSFSLSAGDFKREIHKFMPSADIRFAPGIKRQSIVRSWPAELSDLAARRDWSWRPQYGRSDAFERYLIPGILARYDTQQSGEPTCEAASQMQER